MAQIYAPMSYTSLVAAVPFNLSGETLCVFCDPSGGATHLSLSEAARPPFGGLGTSGGLPMVTCPGGRTTIPGIRHASGAAQILPPPEDG